MADTDSLPDWRTCHAKSETTEKLTALEQFILSNEPLGVAALEWRMQLAAVLDECRTAQIKADAVAEFGRPPHTAPVP